jgi:hypothetical protein
MRFRLPVIVAAFVWAAACGGSPIAPSPSSVAGAWLANSTLTAASGGECVGAALQAGVGSRDVFMAAIKQSSSALEATLTSTGNGTSCAFSGTAANGSLTLNLTTCQVGRVAGVKCAGGVVRDLQLATETVTATGSAAAGNGGGTDTSTWNVTAAGSGTPVGVLNLTASFTWVFLGVPSSDYHVFTGTIFPGYADGTISIPADPNPFCSRCGWFFPAQ